MISAEDSAVIWWVTFLFSFFVWLLGSSLVSLPEKVEGNKRKKKEIF
jgi:hypothetical protein